MKKEEIMELIPALSSEDAQALSELWEEEISKEKEALSAEFDVEKIRKEAKEEALLLAEKKILEEKREAAIESALLSANSKSVKALRALIDLEKVNFSDGELKGLAEQIEEIKNECGFLFFEENEEKPKFTKGMEPFEQKADIDGLSYKERLKLFKEMPELYKKLVK